MKIYDLVLSGGWVIDPANSIDGRMDVAINNGKIALVAKSIDRSYSKKTIDVTNLIVAPGFIDMHTHIYPVYPRHYDSLPTIDGEPFMFRSCVTTAVDAGTCGSRDFETFVEQIINKSKLRILSFINIARGGMVDLDSEQRPCEFTPKVTAALAQSYADIVVGIKTAHYWVELPFDDTHHPWESVDATIEAATLSGLPAMVDFQPNGQERTYVNLLTNHLRAGDIHTHVFAQQFHYIGNDGKLADFMFRAKERGILFDLGHGSGSFWFRNAILAYRGGFLPDSISTDLYSHNVCGPVFDLSNVMSKFLAIGMSLKEVIERVTVLPAQIIGHPELGTLSKGSEADVAIFSIPDGSFGFSDSGKAHLSGTNRILPEMTIRKGEIVYDKEARSFQFDWANAPASYWVSPGIITRH
jgi:dihydroorotase